MSLQGLRLLGLGLGLRGNVDVSGHGSLRGVVFAKNSDANAVNPEAVIPTLQAQQLRQHHESLNLNPKALSPKPQKGPKPESGSC